MLIVLVILVVLVCALLGLIVLIQNPKGGGLSSNFSASSQLMGVQKTGDFLEKGTWVLAITLMVLALGINVVVKDGTAAPTSKYQEQINKSLNAAPATATPSAAPAFPGATTPAAAPAATDSLKK
ncbi:preprotein translocase subunit SecG [Mucilaginibacter auburnensis]|uniref:Protein-export membrane protein SecG n=1 Tax=Mucilaginibacter auburnensis TaxID=1457233 RepID=A0A2H9VSM9_9SPHI|nr:preprotein translocase subunit SecG [Mucilaginibacter auburnensis]PJJ83827.1 preprotein translocase subunit SecG [Mucilaginibacter auburnensis]